MKHLLQISMLITLFNVSSIAQEIQINYIAKHTVSLNKTKLYSSPNPKSTVIDILKKGEKITTLEFTVLHMSNFQFSENWIKIKKESDNKTGYLLGESISPVNQVYFENSDCDYIQKGNWYGIRKEGNTTNIELINPRINTSFDFKKTIISDKSNSQNSNSTSLILRNKTKLKLGKIKDGCLSQRHFNTGESVSVFKMDNIEYFIEDRKEDKTKNVDKDKVGDRIFLIKKEYIENNIITKTQEITNLLIRFGHGSGFRIDFVGDIDSDGIPEVVLSEIVGGHIVTYYLKATFNDDFQVQSLIFSDAKC